MDVKRLSTPDKIIGIAAIVMIVSVFLPWFGETSGWDFSKVFAVVSVGGAGYMFARSVLPVLQGGRNRVPRGQDGLLMLMAGALAGAGPIQLLLTGLVEEGAEPKFGLFLCAVAGCGLIYAAYTKTRGGQTVVSQ